MQLVKTAKGMTSFTRYGVILMLALLTSIMTKQEKGMRTLAALYGAMCDAEDIDIDTISVKSFVQRLCDGKTKCSGRLLMKGVYPIDPDCQKDFYVVVVCGNGEIRSTSLQGEADGKMFHIDCSWRELPKIRVNADWMAKKVGLIESRRLLELRIPGSHDSASYSITGHLSQYARTQNITTAQQLLGGVRYLDFRLGNFARFFGVTGPRIIHGPFVGQLALEDLLQIWAFTIMHSKEVVILDIQSTHGLSDSTRKTIFKWTEALFGDVAIKPGMVDLKHVTLGDIWKSRRRILILSESPTSPSSLIWGRGIILNPWPNTCDVTTLRQNGDQLFFKAHNETHPHFSILQWVVTVKLFCPQGLYQRSLAIKGACEEYLINTGFPFNVVLLDFILEPLSTPGLVEQIIESNKHLS